MGVPEGSCPGTGQSSIPGGNERDRAGRLTGVCPVCLGRFRLDVDRMIPNHAPAEPTGGPVAA